PEEDHEGQHEGLDHLEQAAEGGSSGHRRRSIGARPARPAFDPSERAALDSARPTGLVIRRAQGPSISTEFPADECVVAPAAPIALEDSAARWTPASSS